MSETKKMTKEEVLEIFKCEYKSVQKYIVQQQDSCGGNAVISEI